MNSTQNMTHEQLCALVAQQQEIISNNDSIQVPPAYEQFMMSFGEEEEEVNCIKKEDFLDFVERQDKAGLKKTIANLIEDLSFVSNVLGEEEPAIQFRPEMIKKTKGTRRTGPRAVREIDDQIQCESAVWNGGCGGRCNYKSTITLDCGRKVCKTHLKVVEKCVAIGEAEEDGTLIGWYDNFNQERHNRVKPLLALAKKSRQVLPPAQAQEPAPLASPVQVPVAQPEIPEEQVVRNV